MLTYFASPERSTENEVLELNKKFSGFMEKCFILNSIPNIVLILNGNRQIVYSNKALLNYANVDKIDGILGLRPGELLNCVHANDTEGGCGTSKNCMVCGAANAILIGLSGKEITEECRILTNNNEALDYSVHGFPIDFEGERLVVISVTDISSEKRKNSLERIFFHDILNTAGGIRGFTELIQSCSAEETEELQKELVSLSNHLVEEILAQRDLLLAESNELRIELQEVEAIKVINDAIQLYSKQNIALNKRLVIDPATRNAELLSETRLLRRILGNMIKNALEASSSSETITVTGRKKFNYYVFSVHNSKFIPMLHQLQIFQRSFSSKGVGRGLGTYSIKLLTEKYLYGRAGFVSVEGAGTTFYAIIPIK